MISIPYLGIILLSNMEQGGRGGFFTLGLESEPYPLFLPRYKKKIQKKRKKERNTSVFACFRVCVILRKEGKFG